MKIKGIKRGKSIEVLEEINVRDGAEIVIEIQDVQLISEEERHQHSNEVIAAWKDDTKIAKFLQKLTENAIQIMAET
jgi:antitoxin component of MazEF toxin-antitoxin module